MNAVALFAAGAAVTLLALAGAALLVWGAVLDGRDEQEARLRLREAAGSSPGAVHDHLETALPPAA